MKLALILNPYSGGKKGGKRLPEIESILVQNKIEYEIFISQYHEHIIDICANLDIENIDGIVAIGGDGTNFQVINGLLKTYLPENIPPIGIIPVGSGNSFAKDLFIETFEDGVNAILRHRIKKVDVLSFTQKDQRIYFVNLAGLGFVTDVADTARRFKFLQDASYVVGVLHRTINLAFHRIEMDIDGKTFTGENCFIEFCNSRYTGGDMLMAPDAVIDDGLMDIVIAAPLSRASLLATLPKIYKGTHIHHPAVQYIKAKKAVIRTFPEKKMLPDGEIFGTTPTTVEVHPKMLRYFS